MGHHLALYPACSTVTIDSRYPIITKPVLQLSRVLRHINEKRQKQLSRRGEYERDNEQMQPMHGQQLKQRANRTHLGSKDLPM